MSDHDNDPAGNSGGYVPGPGMVRLLDSARDALTEYYSSEMRAYAAGRLPKEYYPHTKAGAVEVAVRNVALHALAADLAPHFPDQDTAAVHALARQVLDTHIGDIDAVTATGMLVSDEDPDPPRPPTGSATGGARDHRIAVGWPTADGTAQVIVNAEIWDPESDTTPDTPIRLRIAATEATGDRAEADLSPFQARETGVALIAAAHRPRTVPDA